MFARQAVVDVVNAKNLNLCLQNYNGNCYDATHLVG